MKSLIILLAFFVIATVAADSSLLGTVDGAIGCGGNSLFIDMELTDCTQIPCQVAVNTTYTIGIGFMSGETTNSLNWLLYMYYPNGGVTKLSDKMVPGEVEGGSAYTISDSFTIPERFNGIGGELSVMIMNEEAGTRLACGEIAIVVAPLSF